MPEVMRPYDRHLSDESDPTGLTATDSRRAIAKKTALPSDPKNVWDALWRGLSNRCPACGGAALFTSFLKPMEQCHVCQEDWTRHNADDFPPYIVILVIGHVVVTGITLVEVAFHPAA